MINIVMTYYQREQQLLKTLDSFLKYDPNNFEVTVVDDNSPDKLMLPVYPFEITLLRIEHKRWINPAPAFNIGFNYALIKKPDKIIIQNAECYHDGNIIDYVKSNLTEDNYISFSCYSLSQKSSLPPHIMNPKGISFNGEDAWYNHPAYRPVAFHFCSAITTKNLIKINGFDERFSQGLWYDDNYFLHQVKTLGLNILITTDPIVFHQWHPLVTQGRDLIERNRLIYEILIKENKYRADHIYTLDMK